MKTLTQLLYILLTLFLLSCSKMDDKEEIRDDAFNKINDGNELVFDVLMDIRPGGDITLKDTLWVTCNVTDELFTDKVTGNGYHIPLDKSKFTCQLQLKNTLRNTNPEFELITIEGSSKVSDNKLITCEFGAPDNKPKLKIGLVLKELGIYTLNFINYPNPGEIEQLTNRCTEDCENYWYDLSVNPESDNSTISAFIEYHFNLPDKLGSVFDNSDYLGASIYNDAVYSFTVY